MRKELAGILCFAVALLGLTGCGRQEQTAAAVVEAVSAQIVGSGAGAVSENSGTARAAQETQPPIQLDPDLDIVKGLRIAVVAKSTEGSYWKPMKKYMRDAVAYVNDFYGLEGEDAVRMTFEGPDSESNVDDQINTIDAVLAENPSVLCLAAIDQNSCQAQLETAQENGIPVVLFDSGVRSDMGTAYCATDNRAAGAEAAKQLCTAIGKEGKVAVFTQAVYGQSSRQRVKGFKEEVRENYPGVELGQTLVESEEESTGESAEDRLRGLLEEKRVDGIFCTSQPAAEKVLAILEEYPDEEIAVVGFDGGKIQAQAIRDGREVGTVLQDITSMAYRTIQTAVNAALPGQAGGLAEDLGIDYVWVDGQNLDEVRQKGLFYE